MEVIEFLSCKKWQNNQIMAVKNGQVEQLGIPHGYNICPQVWKLLLKISDSISDFSGVINPRQLVKAQLTIAKKLGCDIIDGHVTSVVRLTDTGVTLSAH